MAMRRHHELPFGAEAGADGTGFRLWAPHAQSVSLLVEHGHEPMHPEPGGWWSLTSERARPGTRYRYRVDGAEVPDPASRFQPDGVHAASEVIDPNAYEWRDTEWRGRALEELVIYELHVGTFSDSGTFAGVMAHLDDLRELGVTAIELMPVAAFPGQRNWGYDGVQLYAPTAAYGRPDELKALVEACHARGLAILLDVVYNHFGPEGNYLHLIGRDFFTTRHHTPWGAAINFDGANSRPVRDFFVDNALYWLREFHFDGLRLDAVHAIVDDSRPDIVTEIAQTVRQRIADREIHLFLENDRNEARRLVRRAGRPVGHSAQWNDDLHHALHVLVTGVTRGYYGDYAEQPIAHLGRALASGFAYQGEASPHRDGRSRGEPSGMLPATAFIAFMQNHDQIGNTPFGTRITASAPEPLVHAAVTVVLLSPQIPLLFMGEEWAASSPFLFFCEFGPALAEAVRQGRRREFSQYPEFADPAAQQRLPDPTAETSFLASRLDWSERQREPHRRWLERYRMLLSLRAKYVMPRLSGMQPGGEYRLLGPTALRVDWVLGDGSHLTLAANFAETAVPLGEGRQSGRLLYCSAEQISGAELPPACAAFYLIPTSVGPA